MFSCERNGLASALRIYIPFISSSCFIDLAENSKIILNRSEERGYCCLIPDLRGNTFSFSPLVIIGDQA
jgi:hypothetical protein